MINNQTAHTVSARQPYKVMIIKELSYDINTTLTEHSGLTSLYNNLVPYFSFTQSFTTVIRHSHDSYSTVTTLARQT